MLAALVAESNQYYLYNQTTSPFKFHLMNGDFDISSLSIMAEYIPQETSLSSQKNVNPSTA